MTLALSVTQICVLLLPSLSGLWLNLLPEKPLRSPYSSYVKSNNSNNTYLDKLSAALKLTNIFIFKDNVLDGITYYLNIPVHSCSMLMIISDAKKMFFLLRVFLLKKNIFF